MDDVWRVVLSSGTCGGLDSDSKAKHAQSGLQADGYVAVGQSLSPVQLFATPWTAARPEFVHIHVHWVGDAL